MDGRVYYSDPRTQKTSWEKPPNARVISQPPAGKCYNACCVFVRLWSFSLRSSMPWYEVFSLDHCVIVKKIHVVVRTYKGSEICAVLSLFSSQYTAYALDCGPVTHF